ncbi:LysR family transcriptional regulator [Uniformispora flossi]|uniref:LysR family transcriptional regulator n=1 Tax=Uniformispora flossi TaxID=3390723 RepID=UPI003C2D2156
MANAGCPVERQEIETFLTLARELHFRRTAELLHLSSGRVSQTIAKLERRFGAPLFERTSRRVALTALGVQLRDELLPAHQSVQRAIARAESVGRGLSGVLCIGYASPMAADLVLKAATAFADRHPENEARIREIALAEPFALLRRGEVSLQLSELPVDEPDLTVGPVLIREQRVLVVPRTHRLADRSSVSVEDLADCTLLAVGGTAPRHFLDFHYPSRTPAGRAVRHGPVSADWHAILPLVGAGRGVTVCSRSAERYFGRPDTVWVPFEDAPPIEYALVWLTNGDTALVRAYIETAAGLAAV